MPTTNLHFLNNAKDVNSNSILIFLQPTLALENYNFYAWSVLNPSIGSTQTAVLTNSFSASIASFGDSKGDYSRPVALPTLGKPYLVMNPNNQSPAIGVPDTTNTQVPADAVGLENEATTPPTDLSVKWYVNNNPVVETNNTPSTTLNPGFTATFELKQSIYCMLAQAPTVTSTYVLQTFSHMTEFPVPSNATDLYFEVTTDPTTKIDSFQEVTQDKFLQAQQNTLNVAKRVSRAMQALQSDHSVRKASRSLSSASVQ